VLRHLVRPVLDCCFDRCSTAVSTGVATGARSVVPHTLRGVPTTVVPRIRTPHRRSTPWPTRRSTS